MNKITKMIFRIVLIIFIIEVFIMIVLNYLSLDVSSLVEAGIDATLLALLSSPFLYFFVVKSFNTDLNRRMKIEMKKNNDQTNVILKQARLAQMGEMISMIAHQWRQPLGIISSKIIHMQLKSRLKSFDLTKEEEAQKYDIFLNESFDSIENTVQHLTATIDDFKNFYKPDKKKVKVALEKIVEKSLNIIGTALLNDDIEIIQEHDSKVEIEIHDSELMQVVLNILKNAQDNFKEKQIKNPYIKISTKDRTISIYDNGGGIPEEIIEKIFDPYFSTKNEMNGTGLGLYMSKVIIQEHNCGKLTAENRDDGVCFLISC